MIFLEGEETRIIVEKAGCACSAGDVGLNGDGVLNCATCLCKIGVCVIPLCNVVGNGAVYDVASRLVKSGKFGKRPSVVVDEAVFDCAI